MNVVVAKVGGQKEDEEEEKLPFCWLALLHLAGASKKIKHSTLKSLRAFNPYFNTSFLSAQILGGKALFAAEDCLITYLNSPPTAP